MNTLSAALADVPAATAYLILAAAVLAESVLLVGAFVPTLTLMLSAGALARAGHLDLVPVIAVAAGAVVLGDLLSHRIGHRLGPRLRTTGIGRRTPAAVWRRAETLMARRGGHAVFVARFVPVLRTLVPYLAGATGLPYRRIAPYSAVAAAVWACAEAGSGYAAATVLPLVLSFGVPAVAGVLAVAAAGTLWARTRPRRPAQPTDNPRAPGADRLLFLR